jgi:glycosyltransferase involved in cell wall biosynthesis
MRILIVTDHYPPFIGGAHRQGQLIARAMVKRGHEVAVATPWHGGLPSFEDDDGVSVHRIRQIRTAIPALVRDERQRHQPPFPDPLTVVGLRRLLSRFEPEVVHAYGWIAFSLAVALGRRRVPLLVSARDYGYFCATRTLLRKGLPCSGPAPLKCVACSADYYGPTKGSLAAIGVGISKPLLARKMTGLHSVSNFVHDVTVRHMGLAPDGSRGDGLVEVTIPSFQDTPTGEAVDIEPWLSRLPDQPFILFVGAFRKVKGLETLFAAYERLDVPPPLVLMGTHERDSPTEFPPEAIVITDVPHAAVMAAWDRAMFGVMPSLWPEPFGATVAEGMSRGRPVIGTSIGGHSDMVDETTGILVPQDDIDALAQAMEELIGDPERREAYGKAAAERARSFAAEAVLPRFEQAYEAVLAAGQ